MLALKRLLMSPAESSLVQVPRALVASCFAAALDVGLLVWLVEVFFWNPVAAAVLGYLAGVVVQYVLCLVWVFPAASDSHGGFALFTLFSFVGLGITWGILNLGENSGVPYPVAKFFALGVAFSWNFLSRKWLLFRSTRSSYDIRIPEPTSQQVV